MAIHDEIRKEFISNIKENKNISDELCKKLNEELENNNNLSKDKLLEIINSEFQDVNKDKEY